MRRQACTLRGSSRGLLCAVLIASVLGAAPALEAQTGRVAKLGILSTSSTPTALPVHTGFIARLSELGWVEGRTLALERRYVGPGGPLVQSARELAALKLDVIYAVGALSIRAAKEEITATPVVIFTVGDPSASGVIKNLARPEGNMTGVGGFARDLNRMRAALLKESVPSMARLAMIGNPAQATLATNFRDLQGHLRASGIEARLYEVKDPGVLDSVFAAIARDKMQGLTYLPDPMIGNLRKRIVELAARHKLPAIYEDRLFADEGGLIVYGPDYVAMSRLAAEYVDKILRGAKPGDLPVVLPTRFVMVVNLKTARSLGITIPQGVLLRADKVIE